MTPNIELLKTEFREFCVANLTLRWIADAFDSVHFGQATSNISVGGVRRSLVMEYYAAKDWSEIETIRNFLKVIEYVLRLSFLAEEAKDQLRSLCNTAGFEVDSNGFTVHLTTKAVGRQFKNLIFAADGPKPEIVLSDSISNDIAIVKNEEFCLVYDRPIHSHGLLWKELIDWWKDITHAGNASDGEAERKLYARLAKSLLTPPEKSLWKVYFKCFHNRLSERLPALIPQVYLHYDPYTFQQLKGQKRLQRQRMDFLMLLSDRIRVVIEVDGKQHYAIDDTANPKLYAEMVAEDRKLKLAGYEVYRFGAYELQTEDAESMVEAFFSGLFKRHEIGDAA
jgi:very-short-patch-repair endonuclease